MRSWLDRVRRICVTGGLPEGRPTPATRSSCGSAAGPLADSARGLERQIWQLVPSGTGTTSFCIVRSSVSACVIALLYMLQLTRAVAEPSTTRDVEVVMCSSSLYCMRFRKICNVCCLQMILSVNAADFGWCTGESGQGHSGAVKRAQKQCQTSNNGMQVALGCDYLKTTLKYEFPDARGRATAAQVFPWFSRFILFSWFFVFWFFLVFSSSAFFLHCHS